MNTIIIINYQYRGNASTRLQSPILRSNHDVCSQLKCGKQRTRRKKTRTLSHSRVISVCFPYNMHILLVIVYGCLYRIHWVHIKCVQRGKNSMCKVSTME